MFSSWRTAKGKSMNRSKFVIVFVSVAAAVLVWVIRAEEPTVVQSDANNVIADSSKQITTTLTPEAEPRTFEASTVANRRPEDMRIDDQTIVQSDDLATNSAARAHQAYLDDVLTRALMAEKTGTITSVSEGERLEAYSEFAQELVDPTWSADVAYRFDRGMAQLAGINKDVVPEVIECRSSSCLLRFPRPPGEDEIAIAESVSFLLGASGMIANSTVQQSDRYNDVYVSNLKMIEGLND